LKHQKIKKKIQKNLKGFNTLWESYKMDNPDCKTFYSQEGQVIGTVFCFSQTEYGLCQLSHEKAVTLYFCIAPLRVCQ